MRIPLQLVLTALLTACGSTTLTKSGPPVVPREPNCEFAIYTTEPAGHAEVGSIDVTPGAYATNVYKNLEDFKEAIRPHVCAAGGDAAIAWANGYGMYIKATVLKETSQQPVPAKPTGCQYDSQCKGDRICEHGSCVSPSAVQ
jgi:hypothetical protein